MKKLSLILVSLIFLSNSTFASTYSSDPKMFVSELVNDAISKLSDNNLSEEEKNCFNSFHTFTVQVKNRDKLKKYLEKKKIETKIHYPVPIHLQPVSKFLSYKRGSLPILEEQSKNIISLPIHEFLTKEKIIYICKIINNFYR